MISLSRLATRSLFLAFWMSDSVTVLRIVSGMGNGSSFVIVAGVGVGADSSLGLFLPNRIS